MQVSLEINWLAGRRNIRKIITDYGREYKKIKALNREGKSFNDSSYIHMNSTLLFN
jgi:hypothetical protein